MKYASLVTKQGKTSPADARGLRASRGVRGAAAGAPAEQVPPALTVACSCSNTQILSQFHFAGKNLLCLPQELDRSDSDG